MFKRITALVSLHHRRCFTDQSYFHHVGKEPLKPLTIGKLLEITTKTHGDVDAIVSCHQEQRLNYRKLLEETDRFAAGLKRLGLEKGDRIGLWSPNCLEWYLAQLACARAGLTLVPLNPAYEANEIDFCINKVGIKLLICADRHKKHDYYDIIRHVAPDLENCDKKKGLNDKNVASLKHVVIITEEERLGAHNFGEISDKIDDLSLKLIKNHQNITQPDDVSTIMFSSGTTGKPKAIQQTHFQVVNNSYDFGKRLELNGKNWKVCVQVPFFHAFGTIITGAIINHAGTVVVPNELYNPKKSLEAIEKEDCKLICGTPTMYVDLVHQQKEQKLKISPEIAVSGGALCPPHLFKEMKKVLGVKKVRSLYGLTETTAMLFSSLPTDLDEEKTTTTVGFVGGHLEVKIVDKEGRMVPFGTPGELWVRGYTTTPGYFGDQEKTKEVIGEDKWLKTGDQFVLYRSGYGKIVGRLKEMIIRGGENIYPREIEDFIMTHPEVIEVHVIGVPHDRLGEEVCACVRVYENSRLILEDVQDYCKGSIAHYKIPSKLVIVEEFPKTQSGKIQKFKLVEMIVRDKL